MNGLRRLGRPRRYAVPPWGSRGTPWAPRPDPTATNKHHIAAAVDSDGADGEVRLLTRDEVGALMRHTIRAAGRISRADVAMIIGWAKAVRAEELMLRAVLTGAIAAFVDADGEIAFRAVDPPSRAAT
jgi:hypothetical protein